MSHKSAIYHEFIKPVQKTFGEVRIIGVEIDGHVIGETIAPMDETTLPALRAFFGGPGYVATPPRKK